MPNLLLLFSSYIAYLFLAFLQSPVDVAAWKEIGGLTAFIIVCFVLIRYFTGYIKEMNQAHREDLASKDAKIEKLTNDLTEITKSNIAVLTTGNLTNARILDMLESLDKKI